MINNSTKINKMKNHLSPQIIKHTKDRDIDIEYQDGGLGQAQIFGRVKLR